MKHQDQDQDANDFKPRLFISCPLNQLDDVDAYCCCGPTSSSKDL